MTDENLDRFTLLLNKFKNFIFDIASREESCQKYIDNLHLLDTSSAILLIRMKIKPILEQLQPSEYEEFALNELAKLQITPTVTADEKTKIKRFVVALCTLC